MYKLQYFGISVSYLIKISIFTRIVILTNIFDFEQNEKKYVSWKFRHLDKLRFFVDFEVFDKFFDFWPNNFAVANSHSGITPVRF